MGDKLDGLSMDIEAANKEKLRAIFPECFTEGKLDIDKLLSLCGEYITDDYEKYEFKWKGKSECLRLAQRRSTAALRPCRAESVHFDTTQNLYIEGDNLEVLKLLQKSYFRKVKLIYIDPPYNTGNDFVYEDDFKDPLARYREVTQQTTKSNPETMGRYHTNWLNMMYPRLRLAANLLRDDGVIFISIDDNEVANLRKVCDEVFGEENFIGMFTWQSKKGGGSDNNTVVHDQEYILCYGKSIISGGFFNRIMIEAEPLNCEDEQGKYRRGRELNKWGANSRREDRPTMFFPIPGPNGETVYPIRNDGTEGRWRLGKEKMLELVKQANIEFIQRKDGTYIAYEKIRTSDPRLKPYRTMLENVGTTADGSKLVKSLFEELKVFDFPKLIDLVKKVLEMGSFDDDIILDFFSGSATTAHAVMQLNAEDGGNRRFIMVQLPEVCGEKSEAFKAGYQNICEIGKERIRRAGKKLLESGDGQAALDVGFKVFKLDTSNMKLWDDTPIEDGDLDTLFERIDEHINGLKAGRSDEDLLFEILLKMGYPLTAAVAAVPIDGLTVYKIDNGEMLVCLQEGVTADHIERMVALSPQKIVLAGRSLVDSSAKANAFYLLENRGIELKVI